jgi:hypothetical protein
VPELSIPLQVTETRRGLRLLAVPVKLNEFEGYRLILDTRSSAVTLIAPVIRWLGLFQPAYPPNRYHLTALTVPDTLPEFHTTREIDVIASNWPAGFDCHGTLGLNWLAQFASVELDFVTDPAALLRIRW